MAKYEVGQKVKIREDLKVGEIYGQFFNNEMDQFLGNEVTIRNIDGDEYSIKEDGGLWSWTEEMLSDIVKVKPKTLSIEREARMEIYVERIIVNDPATIMFYRVAIYDQNSRFISWSDTKKVVSKCNKSIGDEYDISKGTQVCLLKAYQKEIEKQLKKM